MGKVFIIDIAKCNGCYDCVIACNDENFGSQLDEFTLVHPSLNQFILKLEEKFYGEPPRVKQFFVPQPCMHCRNAPCVKVCPVDIISFRDDGLVNIDYKECISCRLCMYACPYGSIYFNKKYEVVQKCNGCAHLLDKGIMPRCISACERGAITVMEEENIEPLMGQLTQLYTDEGMQPRVFYRNLPKID